MPSSAVEHTGSADCPGRDVLHDLVLGKLPLDVLDALGPHVERCSSCQSLLENYDRLEDSFVRDVKQLPEPGPLTVRPELERQLQAAEAISRVVWQTPHSSEAAETSLPTQLGQYELLERIGQGGMGVVYKARHLKLKRLVAVKLLSTHRLRDAAAVERFHREMEAVAALDHPHIVRATDANEVNGQHFFVMELVDGIDLAHLVRHRGPLSVAEASEVVRQAALGLQHAHEHGLIHRDLKPSNLMLTVGGTVKLLDLGLARVIAETHLGSELTDSRQVVGTADYMAPEQGLDPRVADSRADVYSLGCTLYFLLAGQAPFAGPEYDTFQKKVAAHQNQPVPPIRGKRADVPEALAALLDRLLSKHPEGRPETAATVAYALVIFVSGADLTALMKGRTTTQPAPALLSLRPFASLPPLPAAGIQRNRSRSRQLLTLVGLAVAITTGSWLMMLVNRDRPFAPTSSGESGPGLKSSGPDDDVGVATTDRRLPSDPGRAPTPSTPTVVRRPRPASWAKGKPPRLRLDDFGVGLREPHRGDHLDTWQVIGPFLHDSTEAAFTAIHPIEQDWVAFGARFPAGSDERAWCPSENGTNLDNLAKLTGDDVAAGRAGVYYAVCWAKLPSLSHQADWELSTDCAWKLCVNGKLVGQSAVPGDGSGQGLQRAFEEGWNELLVKLVVPMQRGKDFKAELDFRIVRPPNDSGRGDEHLPRSMNEPPE